ncbi:Uncharacterised protein [Yersinia frederiksenii]|nr:Uncharacterised protein [Yersinia frederiksenii]
MTGIEPIPLQTVSLIKAKAQKVSLMYEAYLSDTHLSWLFFSIKKSINVFTLLVFPAFLG